MKKIVKNSGVSTVLFEKLRRFSNAAEAFVWQNETVQHNGEWNNAETKDGMTISSELTLKINGEEVPVYASRAAFSTHSYAYAETESDEVSLDVEGALLVRHNTVTVLPESAGVKGTVEKERILKAHIGAFGSFTFVFDESPAAAFTLLVRKKESYEIPEGYALREFEPKKHTLEETTFTQEKTVYRFLPGVHCIDCISLPSHSVLQLSAGAILRAYGYTQKKILSSRDTQNVTVCGSGAIDFSELKSGGGVGADFFGVKNIEVRGVTFVNSNSWTACFTACSGVKLHELAFFSYRIWSDGIMLSDCEHARVKDCFIRTGDDAAEVKSTSDGELRTRDVIFENVAVWTDKGCGFGIVYENNHDTHDVIFKNCSVGFALPNWSDHLGCLTVCAGNNKNATDYDVTFENFEIYCTHCSAISVCAYEGQIRDIYFKNIRTKYSFAAAPVYVNIRDKEKAAVGKLYFENISVNNEKLNGESMNKLVKINVPEGAFEKENIVIR